MGLVLADMEELSAVGEQVFDAECILNKRLRKVRGDYSPAVLVVVSEHADCLGNPELVCFCRESWSIW